MPGFEPLLFGHSSTGSITLQHAQEQAKKLITEAFSILKRIDTPATCQLRHAKQVMKMLSVSSNGSIPL
ncbi:MAG: hypothetical protein H0V70_03810, partial [Ktedonobacteraceae bacterium]|nr:hypothetical protein [Ktedonobacteraceae bacterium]